jgi:Large ribosomal RNA subunit accumulation protein YceD
MTPELHRPLAIDRIGSAGMDVEVEATPAECAALAQRMQLPAVHALLCQFHLRRTGSVIEGEGRLLADVVQTCVVSLEEFDARIAEQFVVRWVPAGQESDDMDPAASDEIGYEDAAIDLGEAAAQQLSLALDPYPHAPGASLPETTSEPGVSPFTALSARRRSH